MLFAMTESRNLCRISARSRSSNQLAPLVSKRGYLPTFGGLALFMPTHTNFTNFTFPVSVEREKEEEGVGRGALIEAEKNCAARESSLPSGMVKKSSITLKPRGRRTVVFRQAPKLSESALTPTALKLFKRCPATVTPR